VISRLKSKLELKAVFLAAFCDYVGSYFFGFAHAVVLLILLGGKDHVSEIKELMQTPFHQAVDITVGVLFSVLGGVILAKNAKANLKFNGFILSAFWMLYGTAELVFTMTRGSPPSLRSVIVILVTPLFIFAGIRLGQKKPHKEV
jgi:hypothetical protein